MVLMVEWLSSDCEGELSFDVFDEPNPTKVVGAPASVTRFLVPRFMFGAFNREITEFSGPKLPKIFYFASARRREKIP